LDGNVVIGSLDAEFSSSGGDDEESMTLHDVLSDDLDGVDVEVARRLDWAVVESGLEPRMRTVLRESAAGYGPAETAKKLGISAPRVVQLRRKCAEALDTAWGADEWRDVLKPSVIAAGKRAAAERRACRAERAA